MGPVFGYFEGVSGTSISAIRRAARAIILTSVAALPLLAAQGASAQTSGNTPTTNSDPAADQAATPAVIASNDSDIVVTAAKRDDTLLNVASSVTALSGNRLQELGLSSFQDFIRLAPGVSFQSVTPGRTQISIRGVNVGTTQPSTSVATYFDEVPLNTSATSSLSGDLNIDPDPFDLQRVEILRGPQGTLYGANALGGVIKYVPQSPKFDRVAAAGSANIGAVHKGGTDLGIKGMINVPMADWAALRVVGFYRKDAGYIDNVSLNEKDVNWAKNRGGRAILELRPLSGLTIKLTALLQRLTTGGDSSVDALRTTQTPAFGDLTQARPIPEGVSDRFNMYNTVVSYDFGFANLISSTAWTRQRFSRASTSVAIDPTSQYSTVFKGTNNKFVQEVRLQSPSASGHGLEWQLGGFYTNEHYNRTSTDYLIDLPSMQSLDSDVSGTIASYAEKAVFANATYYFNSMFDIAGGVRYSHNDQNGFGTNNSGAFNGRSGASDDNKVTWSATGRFHPAKDILLYANVSTGYRAGGPNFFAVGQAIPPSFGPEELTNYEAGLKLSTPDKKATFTLSGFYIDWSSIQLPLIVNRLTFRGNNGTADSKGFEASATLLPVQGLNLAGTLSYTDSRITSDERTGVGAVPGERMAGAPRWSGSLTADFERPISDQLKGFAGGTFTFSSNRPNSYRLSVNTPYVLIPGFETFGLRTGVDAGSWRLTLAADNLFDKRGVTDDYTFPRYFGELLGVGTYYDQLGTIKPRTIRLTFDWSI